MKYFLLALLFISHLQAARIDIISIFIDGLEIDFSPLKKAGYEVRVGALQDYASNYSPYDPELEKIIIFNPHQSPKDLAFLPKEKLVLFVWEPEVPPKYYYDFFSRVYTWNDQLIDHQKFFKFYYPHRMPMIETVPFDEKKFVVMVNANMTFERKKIIRFFETKPNGEFDLYGRIQGPLSFCQCYRGEIPGRHTGQDKVNLLKNYRFCICFENCHHFYGYITEKLFCCFAAGCIPVYWGARNVENYIPKSCFIDFRDFENTEMLYLYLKDMPEEVYKTYLENIREFLKSPEAFRFSPQHLDQLLFEAATSNDA